MYYKKKNLKSEIVYIFDFQTYKICYVFSMDFKTYWSDSFKLCQNQVTVDKLYGYLKGNFAIVQKFNEFLVIEP